MIPAMSHPYLSRGAARLRRALGLDDMARRLDIIEARLSGISVDRYPYGPVYMGDHTALVATRWGAKMLVDTRDAMISPWLILDGLWESHVTDWLHHTLRPGQVFVDVGANVGYFTLLGGRLVGPEGRVVAVEAHPHLAELLRRNVIINGLHGHVTTWPGAAWSETTDLKLHLRQNFASNSSVGSVGSDALTRLGDTEEIIEVHAIALDDLLDDLLGDSHGDVLGSGGGSGGRAGGGGAGGGGAAPHVDVIKVDVEGAEVQAFTGLRRTLAANPGITVMFEWSPAQIHDVGDDPGALVDILADHGFRFRLLESGLCPIDRAGLLALAYGNVVATR
jgi:FkbM family methyltransferase